MPHEFAEKGPIGQPSPFNSLSQPQIGSSGPLGGLFNMLFGKSPQAIGFERESAAQGAMGRFRISVLEKMRGGLDMGAALSQTLADPTQQQVLSLPDFPKNAQEFVDLLKPESEFSAEAPGSVAFSSKTGEFGAQAPGKPPEPTAAEKIVDAILASSNPEERELLMRSLPGTDGRLNVTDTLRLVAGGVAVDPKLLPRGITKMPTPEEATIALTLGTATGPRAPNMNDMLLAAMGIETPGSPLNTLPKEALRGALLIAEQLRRAEAKPGPMAAILAQSPEAKAAGLSEDKGGGLTDLFKKLDEAEAAARGEQVIEPGATGVPIMGEGPKVGGTGGQAPGPGGAQQLTPEQLKSIEAMPVENFAELSRETLKQITQAVVAGTIKLSDEQRQALFEANQANQGGAGGGAQ